MIFSPHMRLFVLTFSVLVGLSCSALTFDGTISKSRTGISFVNRTDKKKYQLTGATPIISTHLAKLSDGDFLSVDGSRDLNSLLLTVNSINYVGLKSLIGTWYGDDSYCYNFANNTDFSISHRSGRRCLPSQDLSYTYLLNPDAQTSSWTMLVSGEYGSYVGDLKVNGPVSVSIELYDSESGEVLRHLNLTRAK